MQMRKKAGEKPSPSIVGALVLGFVWLLCLVRESQAQPSAPAAATTDPAEANALRSVFGRWGLNGQGNIMDDPCSASATTSTSFENSNRAVKCDCTDKNGTICHITKLKVHRIDGVIGPIPEDLQNLRYLSYLNLSQNNLTGRLPAFIGNLTSMVYLAIGGNNFEGTLPPELGNMINLEEWYMDSSGLGGEIPSSFSQLKNMKYFWASDNNLIGRIPDFIAAWTNLTVLRLQGNSFQGPIPSSLANLTNLVDLRIGEIVNGSSSLVSTKNMKLLKILILRNSRISDIIPSDFGESTKLWLLDLSFNNLTGPLPASLFSLSSLRYLFLGNNSLVGSLPAIKSTTLQDIDLSYNELSGGFPPWVTTENNLLLNLVANNFRINSSDSSLPSELSCLQRNFSCNGGPLSNDAFGINCGDSTSITATDGIEYEVDNKSLTTASYFVAESKKWGFSSVGVFVDEPNSTYIWNLFSKFTGTTDSKLFEKGRISPSSLRYYGLGLLNGNYKVVLQFSETIFTDGPQGKGHGRRLFDIYIQGIRQEKDFDIEKEGDNVIFRAVKKEYPALVVDNFLEIHFFWAGKGTCCIPILPTYGPSIAAISVSPQDSRLSDPSISPKASGKKKNTGVVVGASVGIAAFLLFVLGIVMWRERRKRLRRDDEEVSELLEMISREDTFSYAELRTATEGFNPANKLGEGGFGPVFKGTLSDGRVVAVKQLSVESNQGKREFVTEISTISAVHHRNLVKLFGCCFEGENRLLVYEYLENKSLDQALFGENKLVLDWPTRFEICLGTARGLAYLHEESSLCVIHRDVKASNILLDSDLKPKISDFGLAKLYDDKRTHISTRVAGTIGYLAPEYAMRGHLTEKADVFAFGVVALEILCGRPNTNTSLPMEKVYLLEWAWHLHGNNRELEMVDPTLLSYDKQEALRVIGVSLLCTQASPHLRPAMSKVVAMLTGRIKVSNVTSRPRYLTDWQFSDLSFSFAHGENFSMSTTVATRGNQTSTLSNEISVIGSTTLPIASEPMLHEIIGEGR